VQIPQGKLDSSHEVVSIYWFCKAHQAVWDLEESIVLETSRIETVVVRVDA
jgi:hypothetical protein